MDFILEKFNALDYRASTYLRCLTSTRLPRYILGRVSSFGYKDVKYLTQHFPCPLLVICVDVVQFFGTMP